MFDLPTGSQLMCVHVTLKELKDSKNLIPARPEPFYRNKNKCSFLRNQGLRSVGFAYVESDYAFGIQAKIITVTTMEIWEDPI